MFVAHYQSPIGPLTLSATDTELISIDFGLTAEQSEYNSLLKQTVKELDDYFGGTLKQFTVKCHLEGTDFQKEVLQAMRAIPYGETQSYLDLAQRVNHPKAYRAVGSVCANNRIPIIYPCHRVLKTDGGLGGYRGGLDTKKYLLNLEQNNNFSYSRILK